MDLRIELSDDLVAVVYNIQYSAATPETWGDYGGEPAWGEELEDFDYYLEYCAIDGTVIESKENRFSNLVVDKLYEYESKIINHKIESNNPY